MNLERVLSFFIGAEEIPPGSYGALLQPCLNFNEQQPYPTASTCAITLTLPTRYSRSLISLLNKQWILPCYAMVGLDWYSTFLFVCFYSTDNTVILIVWCQVIIYFIQYNLIRVVCYTLYRRHGKSLSLCTCSPWYCHLTLLPV